MIVNKKIIIRDKIYGSYLISEPIIIELLKSKPIQRLKKISQFGVPDKYYHKKNYSRYEHSVGVMILIKILGGSLKEQIAGLLHDASHTAFSHVIDWVIGDKKDESYQDRRHEDVIDNGEIKEILEKYGYDPKEISDYHNFRLLERDAPDLCADRVDYSFREFPIKISKQLFKSIIQKNNEIVFKNENLADVFARNFLKLQRNHWGGFEAVSRYKFFSQVLKKAIEDKLLKLDHFYEDDKYVVKKLLKTKNLEIKKLLTILSKKKMKKTKKFEIIHKKFRHTDPKFINKNGVHRLSEVNFNYKAYLEKERLNNEKGVEVPIF